MGAMGFFVNRNEVVLPWLKWFQVGHGCVLKPLGQGVSRMNINLSTAPGLCCCYKVFRARLLFDLLVCCPG